MLQRVASMWQRHSHWTVCLRLGLGVQREVVHAWVAKWLAMVDSILSALCEAWYGLECHSTARHSNCVFSSNSFSLQKRRHWLCSATGTCPFSAATDYRPLLASLLLSKMTVSFVSVYFWAPFPAGAKMSLSLDQSDCSLHLQQHQYTV